MSAFGHAANYQAMILLYFFPDRYPELNIRKFGLLFLSTPHSGAVMADWKEYLVDLAQQTGKVRARLLTNTLGSFNNDSRKTKEKFGLISPSLPYVCLGEVRKTEVKGYAKMVRRTCLLKRGAKTKHIMTTSRLFHLTRLA